MIIVGVFLKSGSQAVHQSLGRNFHPPPGGVAIWEIIPPLVIGFPGDLVLPKRVGRCLPLVEHPVDLCGLWILPEVHPEAYIAVSFLHTEAVAVLQHEKRVHEADVGIDIRHRDGMRRDAENGRHLCRQVGLRIAVLRLILRHSHIGGGGREAQQLPEIMAIMDKPISYYAFEMLYWCGIREGELLALTPGDFDFKNNTVSINKSYQRLHGQDYITSPKTKKSVRTIKMPKFLSEEMQEYLKTLYGIKKTERIFPISKSYLYHEMNRGAKEAGVKRIRIHDIRHSHVSLLIDMGFSAVAIANRVGHESIDITYRYAHLFPSRQADMADRLDNERMEEMEHVS